MRTTTIIGCLSLILCAHAGCGSKDKDEKKGSGGNAKASGGMKKVAKGGGPVTLASRSIEVNGHTVTVDVPTGWREMKFGGGLLFTKPGGVFNSTVTINSTCEGDCSKIAENIKAMAAKQVKMHAGYYPTSKIVHEGAVAAGGGEFQLDLAKKDGRKAAQYKLVRYEDGWEKGMNCTAMLLNDDVKLVDKFKAACNGMKIGPKKK